MKEREIKETRWLWLMLFISWFADKWHCDYLAQTYQCEATELVFKTPFYWLSVLFGVVDLLLGVLIWRRATTKHRFIPKKWEFLSISSKTEKTDKSKTELEIRGSIDLWKLEMYMAAFVILISVTSLVVDVIKFIL